MRIFFFLFLHLAIVLYQFTTKQEYHVLGLLVIYVDRQKIEILKNIRDYRCGKQSMYQYSVCIPILIVLEIKNL